MCPGFVNEIRSDLTPSSAIQEAFLKKEATAALADLPFGHTLRWGCGDVSLRPR